MADEHEWASYEEAEAEREREINDEWEMWFKMVAVNFPEREGFYG